MRTFIFCVVLAISQVWGSYSQAQDLNAARTDQINRLKNYIVDAIQPSGMVRDSLVLNGPSFHPATPDAAGFALIALSAFDHMGTLSNADDLVVDILSAYTGTTPGVNPARSANGHFYHYLDLNTGAISWADGYSPISSALIVAGAQFAKNHFAGNNTIASLTDQLTTSIDFNAVIHPSLDGGIYLLEDVNGVGDETRITYPWSEYMLVESLALRQPGNNDRALAVKDLWLEPDNLPKRSFGGHQTLTNDPGVFAPAFWVQQQHFFNGDFLHNADFELFFDNQQQADQLYSSVFLEESFRYGLTAGVSPQDYNADRIDENPVAPPDRHPNNVFSPEAVAAWGDMDTFLDFYNSQFPTSDPRYKYGLVRESALVPSWVPNDAGLVDHTFLLFGLVESLYPNFFAERVFSGLAGDFDSNGVVDAADYTIWLDTLGSTDDLRADGDMSGTVGPGDYTVWKTHFGDSVTGSGSPSTSSIPEPSGFLLAIVFAILIPFPRFRSEAN